MYTVGKGDRRAHLFSGKPSKHWQLLVASIGMRIYVPLKLGRELHHILVLFYHYVYVDAVVLLFLFPLLSI